MPRYDYAERNILRQHSKRLAAVEKMAQSAHDQLNSDAVLWGVAGDNVNIDTVQVQQGIDVCSDNGGGEVVMPPGHYQMSDTLFMRTNVHFRGAGQTATYLHWPDLGPGRDAIKNADGTGNWGAAPRLSDFTAQGPGGHVLNPNSMGCQMNGIRVHSNWSLHRVQTSGFRAGFVMNVDHANFDECRSTSNYYNLEWEDGAVTYGDNTFVHCYFEGSYFASIAIFGNNQIVGCDFMDCHTGFGPYGIYCADGPINQGTGIGVAIYALDLAFEAIGNGAIFDESTGPADSITDSWFNGVSMIWHSTIRAGGWGGPTTAITARDSKYGVKLKSCSNTLFTTASAADVWGGAGTGAAGWYFDRWGTGLTIKGRGPSDTTFPMFAGAAQGAIVEDTDFASMGHVFKAGGTISKGDLCQHNGPYDEVVRFAGRGFAGVALNDAVSGQPVIVIENGRVPANCDSTVDGTGYLLRSNPAVQHHVIQVTVANSTPSVNPVIGVSAVPGSVSGVQVNLQGPHYVWPAIS